MSLFYVEYQQSTPLTFTNPVFSNIFNCFLIECVFWSLFVKYFAILSQSQCSISRSLNLAIAPFVDSGVSCCRRAVIHQATISTTPLKCNIPSLIFKVMAEWCITIANLMRHFVFFQTPGHSGLMCFWRKWWLKSLCTKWEGLKRVGGGALRRDDRRGEMQIFPLCLFPSILWIYVAFPIMK